MHLYFGTRGGWYDVDRFITHLKGKWLPFKVHETKKGHNLNAGTYQSEVQVWPIQMWEVKFPREHKDIMLTTCLGKDGKPQHKKHQFWINWIRKALGVQPIPEYDNSKELPIYRKNIEVLGIGTKEDYDFEDGTEAI